MIDLLKVARAAALSAVALLAIAPANAAPSDPVGNGWTSRIIGRALHG